MKKIIIAIDGYSSTGKSTVARRLAKELDYIFVDTGAMYRAVTLYAMRRMLIHPTGFDKELLVRNLFKLSLRFKPNAEGKQEIYLCDENVEKEIRQMDVSNYVSQVATVPEVRKMLVKEQKEMGKDRGIVMDGRDIGTVVFPDAELKIFMTASAEERAKRRYKELIERGDEVTFEEVLENVQKRDHLDSTRKDSPLRKAEDAIEIDNTHTNLDDQFHTILQLAQDRIYGRI
ncbi:(d)CMP kinase [Croceiramulus getboli]|nr:(d)CMP kinase [Flavobacteriaceae bacterium YJPT1-3]